MHPMQSTHHEPLMHWRHLHMLAVLITALGGSSAQAQPVWGVSQGLRILSEIVVSGGAAPSSSAGNGRSTSPAASESRNRAREALADAASQSEVLSNVIVVEEDSYTAPGRNGVPPDNRRKAREYSQGEGGVNPVIVLTKPGSETSVPSAREGHSRNVNKAQRYLMDQDDGPTNSGKFTQSGTTMGVMGKDGVILMVCDGVNNTAGRIGDDTQSGNVLTILINGKPTPARCK